MFRDLPLWHVSGQELRHGSRHAHAHRLRTVDGPKLQHLQQLMVYPSRGRFPRR